MSDFLGEQTPDAEVYYDDILIETSDVVVANLPSYDMFELYDEFYQTCISLRASRYTSLTSQIDSVQDSFISNLRHIKQLTHMLVRLMIHAERLMLLGIPPTDPSGIETTADVYEILAAPGDAVASPDISDAIPTFVGTPGMIPIIAYLDPNSAGAVANRAFLSDFNIVKDETLEILDGADGIISEGVRNNMADDLWKTWALIFHIANVLVESQAMQLSPSFETCRGRICRATALFRQRLAAFVEYVSS
jgi:hypothetical protein